MWSENLSDGFEVRKVRHRVISYCAGIGLDLGCGAEKIKEDAIGIDLMGEHPDIRIDLSANDALRMFSDNSMDYVFSSHCLEDFTTAEAVLAEWWRVVRPGGHIILYGPDPEYYPRTGTTGSNKLHRHDLTWQDVYGWLKKLGNAKKVHASRHKESNEYSWLLIVRKTSGLVKRVHDMMKPRKPLAAVAFPRTRKSNKDALVIRYGAIGDSVWSTPVVRQLKKEGYHVTYNCTEYSAQVLRNNPNIDEFLIQGTDEIPNSDLEGYWETISEGFDRVVNLCGSVEQNVLVAEGIDDEFGWPHKKRHEKCNKNYMDETMKRAGYPDMLGEQPELFFSDTEEILAQNFRHKNRDKFLILWTMSGSSFHKIYPWAEYIAGDLYRKHQDDVRIVTVGDELSRVLEWQSPITMNRSGHFTVRQSMIMTKYFDLVIGPETGILNAASCFDTPKIVLLSHSSKTNLTKYWRNCTALEPVSCACHPCHRIIYSNKVCPKDKQTQVSECMTNIKPEKVYEAFLNYYSQWKNVRIVA